MENKEALNYLSKKYYKVEDIDSNKTYNFVITSRNTSKDLEELLEERNNLLDEIDYLKDDIDMLKGANDHLKSVLDRTEYLLKYEKAKNKELEAKIVALSLENKRWIKHITSLKISQKNQLRI